MGVLDWVTKTATDLFDRNGDGKVSGGEVGGGLGSAYGGLMGAPAGPWGVAAGKRAGGAVGEAAGDLIGHVGGMDDHYLVGTTLTQKSDEAHLELALDQARQAGELGTGDPEFGLQHAPDLLEHAGPTRA